MIELAEYIAAKYSGKVVEVCVGRYFDVALQLARLGFDVYTVDKRKIQAPPGVKFFVDDVTCPKMEIYEGASLIYSIRPPFELFEAIKKLARAVGADCIIKPLYGEHPGGRLVNYKGLYFYVLESRI